MPRPARVVAYLDQAYWAGEDGIHAQRAFVVFLGAVASRSAGFTLLGRLSREPARAHHRLDDAIAFRPLPSYASAASPLAVARALPGSLLAFWRALGDADVAWLLGPSPMAILFALLARVRGRPVVLGVRQNLPAYARGRHPDRRLVHLVADGMERAFRLLARRRPVVVVGAELARAYAGSPTVLPIAVSLVPARDVVTEAAALARSYTGDELRLLTVSRLDTEKNPLLLADILALLVREDPRWRLDVCGDGPLEAALADRLRELGVADHARLLGHVSLADGLLERYRESHAFLHVSFTEGLPQVLTEAFAAGLPIVATDVGGVRGGTGDAALLVPPAQAEAAAGALRRLVAEPETRERLIRAGLHRVRDQTLEAESSRVAALLGATAQPAASSR